MRRRPLPEAEQGGEEVTTTEAIITEVVYVLSSSAQYHLSHEEVRARVTSILTLRGLRLPRKRAHLRALDIYVTYPCLDFEDAVIVALVEQDWAYWAPQLRHRLRPRGRNRGG